MVAVCEQWILLAYAVAIKTMVLLLACQDHLPGRGGLLELEFPLKTLLTFLLLAPLFPFLLHLARNNLKGLEFCLNFAFYRIFFTFFLLKNVFYLYFMCVGVLPTCGSEHHVHAVLAEARRRHQVQL